MKLKNIKQMSAMDLAHKCGVHVDTIYRNRRRRYSTYRLARLLEQVTGIEIMDWIAPDNAKNGDPWKRILKSGNSVNG